MEESSLSATTILIGITVVISWYAFNKPDIKRSFLLNPWLTDTRKQYYRFVTSGFLHADFSHLLWNMFSLYFFGMLWKCISGFCLASSEWFTS